MKEMILRFDEVLSQKVSKATFANLEAHLHADYLTKVYLDKELASLQVSINEIRAHFAASDTNKANLRRIISTEV